MVVEELQMTFMFIHLEVGVEKPRYEKLLITSHQIWKHLVIGCKLTETAISCAMVL